MKNLNGPLSSPSLVSLYLTLLFIAGCGSDSATSLPSACKSSDSAILYTEIAAPSGKATGSFATDGPGPRRILLAKSTNGVQFTRSNKVVTDQGNTPNMLVLSSGRIMLYYTAYNIDPTASSSDGANKDGIAVAVSDDKGSSWKYYCVGMAGFGTSHAPIGDPDVVQLTDGTYRMYVTNGGANNKIYIYSATSTDGLSFTKEGTALDTSSSNYKDSLTLKVGSQWIMYVLRSDNGQMLRATSTDGKTFTAGSDTNFQITVSSLPQSFVLSNWFKPTTGSMRIFAFSGATSDVRSFTTTDGLTLTADSTVSVGLPLDAATEKSWVKDAAVQLLSDGTYLMAYVAETP